MTRRTDYVTRSFVDVVLGQLARGAVSLERAVELMLEHGVPPHVATRIVTRAQQPYPALHA